MNEHGKDLGALAVRQFFDELPGQKCDVGHRAAACAAESAKSITLVIAPAASTSSV